MAEVARKLPFDVLVLHGDVLMSPQGIAKAQVIVTLLAGQFQGVHMYDVVMHIIERKVESA